MHPLRCKFGFQCMARIHPWKTSASNGGSKLSALPQRLQLSAYKTASQILNFCEAEISYWQSQFFICESRFHSTERSDFIAKSNTLPDNHQFVKRKSHHNSAVTFNYFIHSLILNGIPIFSEIALHFSISSSEITSTAVNFTFGMYFLQSSANLSRAGYASSPNFERVTR